MEKAFHTLKWGVILPARYLIGKLASQLFNFSWEEFSEMATRYRVSFQVLSSICLIHSLIATISGFLPGLAWRVCVSSSVMAVLSGGLALFVIKTYLSSGE